MSIAMFQVIVKKQTQELVCMENSISNIWGNRKCTIVSKFWYLYLIGLSLEFDLCDVAVGKLRAKILQLSFNKGWFY